MSYSDQAKFPKDTFTVTAAGLTATEIFAAGAAKKIVSITLASAAGGAGSAHAVVTLQSIDGSRVYGKATFSAIGQTTITFPGFEMDAGGLEADSGTATDVDVTVLSLRP